MDYGELGRALKELRVHPPDSGRASLYLEQIRATCKSLATELIAKIGPDVYNNKFRQAVEDPDLLNAYCKVIDGVVVHGVQADLKAKDAKYRTYRAYIETIFGANEKEFSENVKEFFKRYPVIARRVQNLTSSFKNNIHTACCRIANNWDDLQKTFAPDRYKIEKLTKVESTGSDFHKGGQQVLILGFELKLVAGTPVNGKSVDSINVVYKPSDLEVDCLLAGNTEAVNAVHPKFQKASLFEILNELMEKGKGHVPLPTYKILPYYSGSSLKEDGAGKLPIRTSYGYIQFLEHKDAPGRNILNYYPYGQGDFTIYSMLEAPAIIQRFYQLMGELVAVASTFSITDMHMENVFVSQFRPYLIDLEVSLTKSIESVADTLFFARSTGGITGLTVEGVEFTWEPKRNLAGKWELMKDYGAPFKQNRLWKRYKGGVPCVVKPSGKTLIKGFWDGLTIIRSGVTSGSGNVFNEWFKRLNNAVVRYLPYATSVFSEKLVDIYENVKSDEGFVKTKVLDWAAHYYSEFKQKNAPWPPAPSAPSAPPPNFVVWQYDHVGADFEHGDIPVFYHRIGSRDIMNSSGAKVEIPKEMGIADDAGGQIEVLGPLRRSTFFAREPTDVYVRERQVDLLKSDANFLARRHKLAETLKQAMGLDKVSLPIHII